MYLWKKRSIYWPSKNKKTKQKTAYLYFDENNKLNKILEILSSCRLLHMNTILISTGIHHRFSFKSQDSLFPISWSKKKIMLIITVKAVLIDNLIRIASRPCPSLFESQR